MERAKRVYHRVLMLPGFASSFRYAQRHCATVLMLHRFQDVESGVAGLDPNQLRKGLEYLRRNKYEIVPLAELFERLAGGGRKLRGAVAFTVDDGYLDQAEI
ncbi:MAG: polysaccharide deacetylase, partial [Polyangiales bacterium]